MDGKKKIWATAVLCAVASVGFVVPAGAEETMTHDLDEVIVEADRNTLPGGFVANNDRVGILGNIKAIDVPFTQKKYTEKTIMTFYDPNQPLNGTLANTPSIRIGSTSPMYTDFSMRGVNMNASHYYINGIPNMFNQTRSIPAYILSSVDIVSGPNTVLNGATFSNNGTNGTDAPAGLLNGTTKRAAADPVTRYTQRFSGRSTWTEDLDLGRRFGKNNEWGIRVNAHNEDGGLSIKGADVRDKSIYINLDHQDAKSMTNIFGGYYDWKVNGGQRWLSASGVTKGNLAEAPNGKTDLSFDGQTKYNHGMLFTLNHIQKFSDKWSGFINGGYGHYSEHKNDPNSGSLTLGDNGKLSGKFRDYVSDSKSSYWQVGVSNKAAIGNIKNDLSFAVDYFMYKSKAANSGSAAGQATIGGDLWNGVHIIGTPIAAADIDSVGYSKEYAYAATLADRFEFGKASLYAALQYRDTETESASGAKVSKDSLNPTFAIAYKPVENLSVYASYAQSYTKPVEVSKSYDNAGEIFKPIKNMTPQEFFKKDLFAEQTGVELLEVREGYSKACLVITENHLNAGHRTQGGAIFTLADLALAAAANSHGSLAFSLSSNITFLRASGPGDTLYAEARERYIGRTTGYYQIDITNQDGKLIATFESSVFRKGDPLPFSI